MCGFLDWFPLSEAVGIYMNAGGLAGCCIWTYLRGHGASTANIVIIHPQSCCRITSIITISAAAGSGGSRNAAAG